MKEGKKQFLPSYIMLCLVAVVMAFAISGVYAKTKDAIDAAALEAQIAARTAVMEQAVSMTELPLAEDAPVDYCYEAYDADGAVIGYVCQITVTGFGGEIEVTVGMDMTASITAISVGGANFSETSGLGAKTRDDAFTDQFAGMSGMLVLKQNIDSVTGASVSSGAAVSGVNKALTYMTALLPEGSVSVDTEPIELSAEEIQTLLPGAGNVVWMGGGSDIDGWWQADNGYIVRATGFGEGPIVVTLGFDNNGVVTGILIGDENFMESAGLGARVQEEAFWSQFIGLTGVQTYGEGIDAVSGATVTSTATLGAINAALAFDPQNPGTAAAAAATAEPEQENEVLPDPNPPVNTATPAPSPDAVTAASAAEATATPSPTPDAATAVSVTETAVTPTPTAIPTPTATPSPSATPISDAATAASAVQETAAPTPTATPDAATAASVTEE